MDLYESFKLFLRKKKTSRQQQQQRRQQTDNNDESLEGLIESTKCESDDAGLWLLLEQIYQTNTKLTLEDQVVSPNYRQQKQLDMATVYATVDKMNKRRLNKQDWMSSSDQLENDIIEWILHTQSDQRFELSPRKEFDLFVCQLYSKLDRRLKNQDATFHNVV